MSSWSTGSAGGSGSGWGSPEPDEARSAPSAATGATAWNPGGWGGSAVGGAGPETDWQEQRPASAPLEQSGPPLRWLGFAAVVPLLSAALFVLTGPVVNGVGWALAAFGAVTLLGVFQAQDMSRRASNMYGRQDGTVAGLRLLVLVLAFGVATTHAVFLAFWIARLDVFA